MDLDKLSKILTEKYNNQKLDDFSGFTPKQMHQIIHFPFDLDCPIKMYIDFELNNLKSSPIFSLSYSLLDKINESGKIKLTARGNLPGKLIKSIYDEGFFPDRMIERGIIKLRMEKDWLILHTIHMVLKLSGLIRKTHGNLFLTKKGEKYLSEGNESQLFLHILETYTMKFNWGYNDGYIIEDIGQIGFLYLLYLINNFGLKYENVAFYSNLYFKAFPTFLEGIESEDPFLGNYPEKALSVRFFDRFAYWFGFITYQAIPDLPSRYENVKIKKTKLLESLFV
jgi:hypothetical protein